MFTVQPHPLKSRAAVSTAAHPAHTLLLTTSPPAAHVIYREYAREICTGCLAYDRGVPWKLRDPSLGAVFCSPACREAWHARLDPDVCAARASVVTLLQRRPSPGAAANDESLQARPTAEQVEQAWERAAEEAILIRRARANAGGKRENKALVRAQLGAFDAASAWWVFAGVECFASQPARWAQVEQLARDAHPYHTRADLEGQVAAFLGLLGVLPPGAMWEGLSVRVVRTLQERSMVNVFGLRDLPVVEGFAAPEDPGSEVFGYGLWPEASYWNHSCRPNVRKRRAGMEWAFWTVRGVQEGEELCISYLGGDEETLGLVERREKLKTWWGFVCLCERCCEEEGETRRGDLAEYVDGAVES